MVFVELDADADLDLKLVSDDGTVLLYYDGSNSVHWSLKTMVTFRYDAMGFRTCVDGCTEHMNITYHDGTRFELQGVASYHDEWVYINTTNSDVTLRWAVGLGGRTTMYLIHNFVQIST